MSDATRLLAVRVFDDDGHDEVYLANGDESGPQITIAFNPDGTFRVIDP